MINCCSFRIKILAFLLLPHIVNPKKQVHLSVFYESRCSDSKHFITEQLYPTYKKYGDNMIVDFKPFGKAKLLRLLDGSEKVTCQHGPRECQGNARHACLLSRLSSGSQDRRVEAVDCLMRDRDPDRAVPGCLASLGLARPTAESVERCAGSSEGRDLVRMFSGETEALAPKLDFVPWLLIDDKFDREEFQEALYDLEKVVKRKIGS